VTAELAGLAAEHGRLAIDTEFVSERRYQAQLCLVQVAVPDPGAETGVRTDVLDPLDPGTALDYGPMAVALADPAVQVIVHAGRQDIAILRRTWGTDPTNVFDTQVGAGFLGFGNQEGYESIANRVLGVKLRGGEGFTKWDKRPLTAKQLEYAADDARCLLALGEAIERELEAVGRLAWAIEECRVVEDSNDVRTPERAYEKLPKVGRLDEKGRAAGWRLAGWREGIAREMDRPPAYVVPDQALVELAKRRPKDTAGLENIRGLPPQTLHRRGRELLAEIAAAAGGPAPDPPPQAPRRDSSEAPLVSLAQAVVRHRASENKIATELIATQSELTALVGAVRRGTDGDRVRVLHGWRRELVGAELEALIAGERSVSVAADGRLVIAETSG
jgi:ribonuclease D